MNGTSESKNLAMTADSDTQSQILPNDVLDIMFKQLPFHWQMCTGSHVSQFFFHGRKHALTKLISTFGLDTLIVDPIFQQYPIDHFRFCHSGMTCLPLMAQRFTSVSCLAAFTGNMPAFNQIQGEALLDPLDETDCTVVHFLALGGQNEVLFELVEKHGVEILQAVDSLGHDIHHFAAIGLNIQLIKTLAEKYGLRSKQQNQLSQDWIDMLADRDIPSKKLLLLSELIFDEEIFEQTKEKLMDNTFDLDSLDFIPDFAGQYDITNTESLNQLITSVVAEIVIKRKTHFEEYLCYLLAYKQLNNTLIDDTTAKPEYY